MSIELTWLGHACWLIKHQEHRILLDPFLNDSPTAPMKAADVDADTILVSHGHFDHVADVAEIANRCGSTVVAVYEIAEWFSTKHKVEKTIGMNIGGSLELPFGAIKMTPAIHSSQLPDGSNGGVAAGFLVLIGDKKIYFACDTQRQRSRSQIFKRKTSLTVPLQHLAADRSRCCQMGGNR